MTSRLVIIGSTRKGRVAALKARRGGLDVTLINRPDPVWGCLDISERLREATIALLTMDAQSPERSTVFSEETLSLILNWKQVVEERIQQWNLQFNDWTHQNAIRSLSGLVEFTGTHSVAVHHAGAAIEVEGEEFVLAEGTQTRMPLSMPLDDRRILTAEDVLNLPDRPRHTVVVGAGMTGLQATELLGLTGHRFTVIEPVEQRLQFARQRLNFLSSEPYRFQNDEVIGVDCEGRSRIVWLASGRHLVCDSILIATGRDGCTGNMNLESVGVLADERGRVWCDQHGNSWKDNIRVLGDLVGYPRRSQLARNRRASLESPQVN